MSPLLVSLACAAALCLDFYKKLSLHNAGTNEKSTLTLAPFLERTVVQIFGDKTFTCCLRHIVGQKLETSSSVFVNWKFVKTSSNIYFGNNCKSSSADEATAGASASDSEDARSDSDSEC